MEQVEFDFDLNDSAHRINRRGEEEQPVGVEEGWAVHGEYSVALRMEDVTYGVVRNPKYLLLRVVHRGEQFVLESGWKGRVQRQSLGKEESIK